MSNQATIDGVPEYALQSSMRDFRVPTGPDLLQRVEGFFYWQQARRQAGLWPFSRATEKGPTASCAVRDDQGVLTEGVNFASQDYLSLSSHPRVITASMRAALDYGVHSAGSPVLVCERVTTDADGRPVLFSHHVFPAHRTEFVVELPHAEPSIAPTGLRLLESS